MLMVPKQQIHRIFTKVQLIMFLHSILNKFGIFTIATMMDIFQFFKWVISSMIFLLELVTTDNWPPNKHYLFSNKLIQIKMAVLIDASFWKFFLWCGRTNLIKAKWQLMWLLKKIISINIILLGMEVVEELLPPQPLWQGLLDDFEFVWIFYFFLFLFWMEIVIYETVLFFENCQIDFRKIYDYKSISLDDFSFFPEVKIKRKHKKIIEFK